MTWPGTVPAGRASLLDRSTVATALVVGRCAWPPGRWCWRRRDRGCRRWGSWRTSRHARRLRRPGDAPLHVALARRWSAASGPTCWPAGTGGGAGSTVALVAAARLGRDRGLGAVAAGRALFAASVQVLGLPALPAATVGDGAAGGRRRRSARAARGGCRTSAGTACTCSPTSRSRSPSCTARRPGPRRATVSADRLGARLHLVFALVLRSPGARAAAAGRPAPAAGRRVVDRRAPGVVQHPRRGPAPGRAARRSRDSSSAGGS